MTLYRIYRPQNFEEVAGQTHIIKTIENQIVKNKIAQAYLFSGPRGVGKTTTARLIAKAVNCETRKPDSPEPCDKCNSCLSIIQGRSIDVIEIDAASNTGVENVRENIIENSHFQPTSSKFKIFIVDEVHMLSTSAFNALLKTLEEPPSHVIFILATTELHKLPETIISRCQRFIFKKIDLETMKSKLLAIAKKEKVKIEDAALNKIAQKSEGCLRDAISLLDQITSGGEKNITAKKMEMFLPITNYERATKFVKNVINQDKREALNQINNISETGSNIPHFSDEILGLLRIMLITKNNSSMWDYTGAIIDEKNKKQIIEIQKNLSNENLIKLIDLFLKRKEELSLSPIAHLPLEMFVIEWNSKDNTNDISTETKIEISKKSTIEPKKINNIPKIISPEPITSKNQDEKVEIKKIKKTNNKNLTTENIANKWPDFIKKVEKIYPTLVFILKMATVSDFENSTLTISVPYSFHKDKLTEQTIMPKIRSILDEILDSDIELIVNVQNQNVSPNQSSKKDPEIEQLAKLVGGEIL